MMITMRESQAYARAAQLIDRAQPKDKDAAYALLAETKGQSRFVVYKAMCEIADMLEAN